MNDLAEQQFGNNAASRDGWETFRAHRAKVTDLLRSSATPGASRLCVLGAGNCNDLDLAALLAVHGEIHLVDLDAEALAAGVARQGLGAHPAVHRHGGLDLTGALDELARWSPDSALGDDELAACAEAPLARVRPALPGPFDVAASTCLLSQLLGCVVRTAGERHPRFLEALRAVRAGHLRLLADLVAPGGVGVLIGDLVSSDTFPSLGSVPEAQLPAVTVQLIQARNFFHGVNPAVVASLLQTDPVVGPQAEGVEGVRPWLWHLGPRVYLVYACKFRRRVAAPP